MTRIFEPDMYEARPEYIKPDIATDFLSTADRKNPGEIVPIRSSHLSDAKQREIIAQVVNLKRPSNIPPELAAEYDAISFLRLEAKLYDGYNSGGTPMLLPPGLPLREENLIDLSEHSPRDFNMDQTHKYGADFCRGILALCDDIETLMQEAQISLPLTQGSVINKTYLTRQFGARLSNWRDNMRAEMRTLRRDDYPGDGFTLRDTVRALGTDDAFEYVSKLFPEARDYFKY